MLQNLAPQRRLFIGAPATEPLAGLEAKLPACRQRFEIRRRTRPPIDIGQHRLVDREGQIGTDEIGVLERAQYGEPPAEARLDHGVDGFGVADAVLDQRNCLSPQGMLQAVADEAGYVLLDVNGHFTRRLMQRYGPVDRLL